MGTDAIWKSWRGLLLILAVLLATPFGVGAAEIDLSTYNLQANMANQTISIYVVGGTTANPALEMVNGVNFEIETGDGGPNLGGMVSAPLISNVNLLATGAVFANNNTGQGSGALQTGGNYDPMGESQFWEATTQTASGNDSAMLTATPQLLATVTFDTTGFFSGTFNLVIDDPRQPTNFPYSNGSQMFPTVIDGMLEIGGQVAPEPASIGLLALAAGGILLRRRRADNAAGRAMNTQ